jgi:hypothetical protein
MSATQNEINPANFINPGNKLIVTIAGSALDCASVNVSAHKLNNKTFVEGNIYGYMDLPGNRAAVDTLAGAEGAVPAAEFTAAVVLSGGAENEREFTIELSAASATNASDIGGEAIPKTSKFQHVIFRVSNRTAADFCISYKALNCAVKQGARVLVDWAGLDETRNTDIIGNSITIAPTVAM